MGKDAQRQMEMKTPATYTITQARVSEEILAERSGREFLQITNMDLTNGVFLGWGDDAAVLNAGIYLQPDGGAVLFDVEVPAVAVNAISGAGNPIIAIQEGE